MLAHLLAFLLTQSAAPAFLREPDIHGDKVVFTCEGDLWLGDLTSGSASRLTRDEGREAGAKFSQDGKWIGYHAEYGGIREVFVIPTEGGQPRQITHTNERADMIGWTPDGKSLIYGTRGYPTFFWLFTIPFAGGAPTRFPLEYGHVVSFAPDGNRFVFTRVPRAGAPWFRYEGGRKNDIWTGDLAAKKFKKVYESKFTNEYPIWSGERICWVHDEGNGFSIMAMTDGGTAKRIAGPYDVEVRYLRGDGKRLIYEKGVGLEMLDLASNKTQPVNFQLLSDFSHTLPYLSPANGFLQATNLGQTGKRILAESRGQILSVPSEKGEVRVVLAKNGVRYRYAVFSPDAKKIAYISDETREQQLYVSDADGGNPKQLTKDTGRQLLEIQWSPDGKWIGLTDSKTWLRLINTDTGDISEIAKAIGWNGPHYDFSPDSKWIVYDEINRFLGYHSIMLYNIATKEKHNLSDGMTDDFQASFSQDGKYIAFLSQRSFSPVHDDVLPTLDLRNANRAYLLTLRKDTPSPFLPENDEEPAPAKKEEKAPEFRIDLDGLASRVIEVPAPPKNYTVLAMAGDRVLLRSQDQDGPALTYYDLKAKKGGKVAAPAAFFQVSGDGKKLLIRNGASLQVVDASAADVKADDGRVSFGNFQLRINPVAEWEEMYWDAWRLIRDYFYAENMHGNDWPAIGQKYAAMLPGVRSRDELNDLIRFLLAELSVSHAGVGGGDIRGLNDPETSGFLGVDLEPDPSGFYKIAKILTGDGFSGSGQSPFAEPGQNVKAGDYLLEVAGIPAKVGSDFMQGLVGRAGQVISVKVNTTPSMDGARTLFIKPIANENQLRYQEWVKERRDYVNRATNGRFGYLHIANMVTSGFAEFAEQYFPQRNKQAMIIDVRFNSGGNVSTHIINILQQRLVAYFNQRNSDTPWTRQGGFFPGPMVCLINEFSASNGEEFPHHFRALKLGPLVGRRTWGGEVGSDPGWPLADGGTINIPNYGAWTPTEGWVIEGTGIAPDYEVDNDPNLWVQGKDPQLDKAIALMEEEVKKHPWKQPTHPAEPVKVHPK